MPRLTAPSASGPKTPFRSAKARIAASCTAAVLVAVCLVTATALPQTAQIATVSRAAGPVAPAKAPDFYPWVRPAPVALPEGLKPWARASKPRKGGFITQLNAPLADTVFEASNHGNSGSFYGGDWLPDNILSRSGGAFLEVRRTKGRSLPYTAAEMKSDQHFGYGRYETIMQPARGSGLVTAFFTFTGEPFGDPHDEIDIEFLGSDTTKIHFNYFKNGRKIKPATFDLPFDASAKPHLYAFEWRPDGITWFVDGEPVYATETGDKGIPSHPGKVMFSAWTGIPQMAGWHGPPLFRDGSGAQFNCVSFTPLGHDTPKCSDSYEAG